MNGNRGTGSAVTTAEHGTTSTYRAGCRCEQCREANAAYIRAYRERRAAVEPVPPWQRTTDLRWMDYAACRDEPTRIFFANNARRPYSTTTRKAIEICERCDVRLDCLEYALELPAPWHGIFGGLDVGQRLEIYKTRHNRRPT